MGPCTAIAPPHPVPTPRCGIETALSPARAAERDDLLCGLAASKLIGGGRPVALGERYLAAETWACFAARLARCRRTDAAGNGAWLRPWNLIGIREMPGRSNSPGFGQSAEIRHRENQHHCHGCGGGARRGKRKRGAHYS